MSQGQQGVAEGFDKEAEAYKAHLLKTAPKVMDFLSKAVKGWRPSKEEMLGAIDTGYIVMKHTGDVKQAGKAMMDELNTLHRMSQGQQGVSEGAPIVVAQAPIDIRNPKKAQPVQRYMGDIVPPTKPPSTEKRGVKGRPGQRPMPQHDVDENQGWAATYEETGQMAGTGATGGMTASYQQRENQPVDEDYIEEKWSAKYKSSINCSDPKGFSQRAHCAGRKK
jgi:hypothetical protein